MVDFTGLRFLYFGSRTSQEERQSIEGYLGKKWGINMTIANI